MRQFVFILKATISALHHIPASERCSRAFYHLLSITETSKRALLLLLSGMAEQRNRLPDPSSPSCHCCMASSLTTANPCCINDYLNSTGSAFIFTTQICTYAWNSACVRTTDKTHQEELIYSGQVWKHAAEMIPPSMVKTLAFALTRTYTWFDCSFQGLHTF